MSNEKSVRKILDSTYDIVAKICYPLFKKTDVTHFDYFRFYDSGEMMSLGTAPEFLTKAYLNNLVPTKEELSLIYLSGLKITFLSHYLPLPAGAGDVNPEKYDEVISKATEYAIYHRLCFVERCDNYYRACTFGVSNSAKSIFAYYINIMCQLEKFIKYFEIKVEELFPEKNQENTIILPNYHNKILPNNQKIDPVLVDLKLDVSEKIDKYSFSDNAALTTRENDCLSLIAQGYTMKIAARKLHISPRTVEQHLRNIKDKYGLTTKNQLVEIWHELVNDKFFAVTNK